MESHFNGRRVWIYSYLRIKRLLERSNRPTEMVNSHVGTLSRTAVLIVNKSGVHYSGPPIIWTSLGLMITAKSNKITIILVLIGYLYVRQYAIEFFIIFAAQVGG